MKSYKDFILRIKNQSPVIKNDNLTNIVIFNNNTDIQLPKDYEIIEKEIEINYMNMSFKDLLERVIPEDI